MFTYEFECTACNYLFESHRTMEARNLPASCPRCKKPAKKVIATVRFNEVFAGSFKHEDNTDKAMREGQIAQAEGFRSKMEYEVACEAAHDRAKKLGLPPERILGGVKSPFQGEVAIDKNDQIAHQHLVEKVVSSAYAKPDDAKRARKNLKEFEAHTGQKYKAAAAKREFKPHFSPADLKKQVKKAQSDRKSVGV